MRKHIQLWHLNHVHPQQLHLCPVDWYWLHNDLVEKTTLWKHTRARNTSGCSIDLWLVVMNAVSSVATATMVPTVASYECEQVAGISITRVFLSLCQIRV